MATSAHVAFLLSRCSTQYAATQYAMLSSLIGLGRSVLVSPAGFIVSELGWQGFYLTACILSFIGVGAVLLIRNLRILEE